MMGGRSKRIKVYYALHQRARGRQVDAAFNVPNTVESVLPINWEEKGEGVVVRKNNLKGRLARWNPISIKNTPVDANGADLIYGYSTFISCPGVPYVAEIDNPGCLTHYAPLALKNPIVVSQMRGLINKPEFCNFLAMSDAAKTGMLALFGEQNIEKIERLYPPPPSTERNSGELAEVPRFLFVGYDFYRKGGKEIAQALGMLDGKYNMTFISPVPREIVNSMAIHGEGNIRIMEKVERKTLISKIMPENDVIMLPSYAESFGITAYEGVNIGMAAIVSNVYALPEMVENGKSGFVLEMPYRYFEKNGLPNTGAWLLQNPTSYAKNWRFPSFVKRITESMQYYIDNPSELKRHKERAKKIAEERFSIEKRNRKLSKIFSNALK